jgi:hypothetical protein
MNKLGNKDAIFIDTIIVTFSGGIPSLLCNAYDTHKHHMGHNK